MRKTQHLLHNTRAISRIMPTSTATWWIHITQWQLIHIDGATNKTKRFLIVLWCFLFCFRCFPIKKLIFLQNLFDMFIEWNGNSVQFPEHWAGLLGCVFPLLLRPALPFMIGTTWCEYQRFCVWHIFDFFKYVQRPPAVRSDAINANIKPDKLNQLKMPSISGKSAQKRTTKFH